MQCRYQLSYIQYDIVIDNHIILNINMNIEYQYILYIHIVKNCNDISRKGVRVRAYAAHPLEFIIIIVNPIYD